MMETGGVSCCVCCACVCCEPRALARRGNLTQEGSAAAVRQHRMIRPRDFRRRVDTMRAALPWKGFVKSAAFLCKMLEV